MSYLLLYEDTAKQDLIALSKLLINTFAIFWSQGALLKQSWEVT